MDVPHGTQTPAGRALAAFDPAWLFLLSGLALVAATALIPAAEDLADARWRRDRLLAMEDHALERLDRGERYLSALQRGDEVVERTLAAVHRGEVAPGRVRLAGQASPTLGSADVLATIEPPPPPLPERPRVDSVLTRLATGSRARLWLIAAGMLCVMIGVLPPSAEAGGDEAEEV